MYVENPRVVVSTATALCAKAFEEFYFSFPVPKFFSFLSIGIPVRITTSRRAKPVLRALFALPAFSAFPPALEITFGGAKLAVTTNRSVKLDSAMLALFLNVSSRARRSSLFPFVPRIFSPPCDSSTGVGAILSSFPASLKNRIAYLACSIHGLIIAEYFQIAKQRIKDELNRYPLFEREQKETNRMLFD